ncbi:MAG: imidazoleglycerol-phosphate dehydratase HisB [Epsilonproteobacteria bacterium]|nr:imidazoleglycerol-phosphate dehydratase HisB [Campylobacterota bacterium]
MIEKKRKTKETDIVIRLNLYGSGKAKINSGVGFFDHMLESFAKHSLIDLEVECKGDLHIDAHHSVEDIAIVLGWALNEAIYPLKGVERFGNAVVVMDEASVSCDIDLSNRAYLVYDLPLNEGAIGNFDLELVEEFFKSIAFNIPINLHLTFNRGKNRHHIAEAAFKAFAVALRRALSKNERISIPSTKGVL